MTATLRQSKTAVLEHTRSGVIPSRTVTVQLHRDRSMCFVPVTFDPKAVFGKIRAPVRVTLNGYTYRSTIASMGGVVCIPLRKSNREAAGLTGEETLPVKIELDTQAREVELPKDLADALRSDRAALKRWEALSYTHKREHVVALEGARKPETRARRFAAILQALRAKREP